MRVNYILCITLLVVCFTSILQAETVYFIAGEINPNRGESFVVPITDANDIAHARDLIEYGPGIGEAIFTASINCGIDGINRNYLVPFSLIENV